MAWMIVPAKWVLGIAPCRQARLFKKTSVISKKFHKFFTSIFFVFQGVSRCLSLKNEYLGVTDCQALHCKILVKMAFQISFLEWF